MYMEQPPGFQDPQHPDYVCQLDRSLYGLNQLPWQWNIELHRALVDLGLSNSKYNPNLYFKLSEGKLVNALTTHVDNLAIVGEPHSVDKLISLLGSKFQVRANEDLHHFLSLKITCDFTKQFVFLNQAHYIDELCEHFLKGKHPAVATPADSNFKNVHRRKPQDGQSSGPHNQIVGSLLWVSECTQPDISFVANRLSQHLCDPAESHLQAEIWVLNYLVSTKHLKLRLGGKLELLGFSDSDWAEERENCK